jgi:hypothetical protein
MIRRPFIHLWKRLRDGIAQNVPEEDALCAFDCHKAQCSFGEWEMCDWRRRKAAGEFTPLASPAAGNGIAAV